MHAGIPASSSRAARAEAVGKRPARNRKTAWPPGSRTASEKRSVGASWAMRTSSGLTQSAAMSSASAARGSVAADTSGPAPATRARSCAASGRPAPSVAAHQTVRPARTSATRSPAIPRARVTRAPPAVSKCSTSKLVMADASRVFGCWGEMWFQPPAQRLRRHRACEAVDLGAVAEQHEERDAADLEPLGELWRRVDIDLDNLQTPGVLAADALDGRRDHATWAAP